MIGKKEDGNDAGVLKWALIRFAISVAAALITVGIYVAATKDEAKEGKQEAQTAVVTNKELIDAIVNSCEENGNPVREVLQNSLKREIEQASNAALYEELFPEADPKKLGELIAKNTRIAEHELSLIEPIDCRNQYPDPDEREGAK